MSEQQNQFGEPWAYSNRSLRDADNTAMIDWDEETWRERRARICECVSALAGIDSPVEFVQRAKAMRDALHAAESWLEKNLDHPGAMGLMRTINKALYKPLTPPAPEQEEVHGE